MKKLILGLSVWLTSSITLANPILTCKGSDVGGALVKQLIVERGAQGLEVKILPYIGGWKEVRILKSISTPVSSKLMLSTNTGFKTSLVIYKKQAVMLYELESKVQREDSGALVEFLSCQ